ncbi:MAG: hypothetical protein EPO65_04175 [Dehalococcoidia bacterium]|nr:MAG: hypothetical protein EPO65_04175 [Dehalococcoidia bacterium]
MTHLSPRLQSAAVAVAFVLALLLAACGGNDKATPASSATAVGSTGGGGAAKAPAAVTAQTRAIGAPQPGTVPVWLTSYAVLAWSDHVDQPGRVAFTISNRSLQRHSFAIIRFDGDLRALPRSSNQIATNQVKVVGQTDALEPGREVDLSVNLEAGKYVLTSLFAQDYTDGMAATFTVGGSRPSAPKPKLPADGALGIYVTENGAFASNGLVRSGKTKVTVQNLGTKAREVVIVRWRGADDSLPTKDGVVLVDGLQEVHPVPALLAGEEAQMEIDLRSGFSYVVASLVKDEYDKGIRTQFKAN